MSYGLCLTVSAFSSNLFLDGAIAQERAARFGVDRV